MLKKLSLLLLGTTLFITPVRADYMQDQAQTVKNIASAVQKGMGTPEAPLIMVNPYGISPLTALITFETPRPAQVGIRVHGKDKDTTITHQFTQKTRQHIVPVYGLYEGKNTITLTVTDDTGTISKDLTITTEKIPLKHTVNIIKADTDKMKEGLTFVTPGVIVNSGSFMFAFDKNGDVRWVLTDPIMGKMAPLHVLKDHTLMISSEEYDPKYTVAYHSLYELDLMGRIRHKIKAEDDVQHDIVVLPNGNYLALVNATGNDTIADYIVELDRNNQVVDRFDMKEILGLDNPRIPQMVEHYLYKDNYHREKMDFMHLNSVNYDPQDDSIIMTNRFYHSIIKIDRKTKQVKWILANPIHEWLTPALKEKLLKPTDKDFHYVYGAHAVKPQGNRHYTVLDNGLYRDLYERGYNKPHDSYNPSNSWSRGVEFAVDEDNMTVSTVFEYQRGPILYNHYLGDVDKYANGHYLMNFGAVVADKDETIGSVEAALNPAKQPAKSFSWLIEVKDGEVVFEAQTDGLKNNTMYRVERINPYMDENEYDLR
ncbi:MAG: aryl-sulfate sulfotransferase [Alphaproteobacteria bacterium]